MTFRPLEIFVSYSVADEQYVTQLLNHLSSFRRKGLIRPWNQRQIRPGDNRMTEVSSHLEEADIILAIVSSDFLSSDYFHDVELKRALVRHSTGEARLLPIIVRPCDWESTALGDCEPLPRDGRPVNNWPDQDDAWLDVVRAIQNIVNDKRSHIVISSNGSQSHADGAHDSNQNDGATLHPKQSVFTPEMSSDSVTTFPSYEHEEKRIPLPLIESGKRRLNRPKILAVALSIILVLVYLQLTRNTDANFSQPGTALVMLGSGNVFAYLGCHAPQSMAENKPLILEGGSITGMRLIISAFEHGITTAAPKRPGLVGLLSENPTSLWQSHGMPIESMNAPQNYFYYAQIAEARPIFVYFQKNMKSRIRNGVDLARPCKIAARSELCIDAEELWRWVFDKDSGDIRIGIPGSGSATRIVLMTMLCEYWRTVDKSAASWKCLPQSLDKEMPIPIPRVPFDLREDLIPQNQSFFYIGSDLVPSPIHAGVSHLGQGLDCGPSRPDIEHAYVCRSVDIHGVCQNPLTRPYFIFGKWAIDGQYFVVHSTECALLRAMSDELNLPSKGLDFLRECRYHLPDKPLQLTKLW